MRTSRPLERSPSLAPLLARFCGRKVLVVGDLVADQYIYGETDRISREAPVLIVRHQSSDVKLGGAGNAAANLRALGARVTAIGSLGRDELGAQLRALCRDLGVRLATPKTCRVPTESKTRILAGGVNTRRQQMLRLDRGSDGKLPPETEHELARLVGSLAQDAEAILVSDYGAGVLGEKVIAEVLAAAHAGVPVVVDSRYNLQAFDGATVLKPNEPELCALTGLRTDTEEQLLKAIRRAQRLVPNHAWVVTLGCHGMAVAEGSNLTLISAHGEKELVDVTGAGDTVGSALTLGLAAGANVESAARIANVAGALQVQKVGTATVSLEELTL
ncbi:MAG: bifunctional hydroxymethylpyrimidine kinase/phosphomethylpyrimidine kinase, partial [Deltaproteobacteria bacterium]|nr:bifunctional hydroxymethylpyrimidine kinase/phosphomethylpyrimidine kinase [Deltaproteobacteria bacterium]